MGATGLDFYGGAACYYQVFTVDQSIIDDRRWDWQIDVNVTHLRNAKVLLHNGTSIYMDLSENFTEITPNSERNHTFNVTKKDGSLNNIYLAVVSDEAS